MKKYKIPSRSQKGKYRIVEVDGDSIRCDCPASKAKGDCFHIRVYKRWAGEVKGNPEYCFYTHDDRFLEEHHILRGADRQMSLTIWLTRHIHRIATENKDFEQHLIDLFINSNPTNMNVQFNAKIKSVSIKNLASMDKGLQIELYSDNISEAMKLAQLKHEKMIRLDFKDEHLFAIVKSVKKINLKLEDLNRAEITLSAAPAELIKVATLGVLDINESVVITTTRT
jgi:hypothetical protein